MTMEEARITELFDDGDYFEGLGLRPGSPAIEIAATAARLAGNHPDLARTINAVGAVLRDPEQCEVYLIARQARDDLVSEVLEPQLRQALPDLRKRVWYELQQLLACEFALGKVNIGPVGARSLARHYEWVKEAVVNAAFPVIATSPAERRTGVVYRTLICGPECTRCAGAPDGQCRDECRIDIPSGAAPGTLLGTYGEQTGRFHFVILDRAVVAPRPRRALTYLYLWHRERVSRGWGEDLALESVRARIRWSVGGIAIGYAVAGAGLGLLISSWLVGLASSLPYLTLLALRSPRSRARYRVRQLAALVAQPVVGAAVGAVLATAVSGLLTGVALSGAVAFFVLLLRFLRRILHLGV